MIRFLLILSAKISSSGCSAASASAVAETIFTFCALAEPSAGPASTPNSDSAPVPLIDRADDPLLVDLVGEDLFERLFGGFGVRGRRDDLHLLRLGRAIRRSGLHAEFRQRSGPLDRAARTVARQVRIVQLLEA